MSPRRSSSDGNDRRAARGDGGKVDAAPVASVAGSVFQRGAQSFRETLREATRYGVIKDTPYGFKPILVLTIASAAISLDSRILTFGLSQIVPDLDADIPGLISILSIVAFFSAIGVVFLGWLADRIPRTPIVGIGTMLSGVASMFTARVSNTRAFGAARVSDALAGDALEVPIGSLLGDYYPVEVRGKVFAFRGVIARVFRVGAPIIVGVSLLYISWRTMYTITGVALLVAGLLTWILLKEPVRGYMERRGLGASEAEANVPEPQASFGESWRTVWSIRTLRRLFIAEIPARVADFSLGIFLVLWSFEHYGMSSLDLGLVFAGVAAASLPFGFISGGVVDQLVRYRPQRVLVFTGILTLVLGPVAVAIGLGPPLWVFVVIFIVYGCASSLVGPARSVLFVNVLPAHMRTIGLNVIPLAELPAALIRGTFIAWAVTQWGTQGGLYVAAPFYVVSAVIELSAAGFFERDMRNSLASQVASSEWRKAKAEGRGKMLVCRGVDVAYDGIQVVFDVDFDVEEGDVIALLGTNGAGKSTLLKAIAGIQEASGGAIVYDGRDVTHMPPNEVARHGVVLMPGGRGIFPDLSVHENLVLGNWMSGEESESRLEEVYGIFPALRDRSGDRAQLLSGGEQQMLSLAMGFLSKPRLLMIDELSLGLSPAVVQQLIEIVGKIHEQGTTIIIVEQSVNVALTIAERAIFMEKGEVKFAGETAELLRRPDILRAVYVKGTGALMEGTPASARKTERELRSYELDRARFVLEAKGLRKAFGGVVAVDDVSFGLRQGEALGLIGPNGAGKTTVFDLISGYQFPDAGSIELEGVDVTDQSAEERARNGLVRRFQDARLFPSLTVYENILAALERRLEVRSMLLTSLQLPQARRAERRARRRADNLIELLDLGSYRDKFAKELSTGLRRITDIACVLATEPQVLLLDEPSTGIAQAEAESLGPLLRRVRHETGCSLLVIEHDMTLISTVADELLAMDQGRTVLRGTPDEVLNDDRVVQSYLGTSEDVIRRTGAKR